MLNILDLAKNGFSILNTSVGFAGSLITIFDRFKNQNKEQFDKTQTMIREKSNTAYDQYCEYRKHRAKELGVPLKKDVLGYWEHCMQRGVLPSTDDMAASHIATAEEAEILLPYLMEQWMTVPEFSSWMRAVLSENKLDEISNSLTDLPQVLEAASQLKAQFHTLQIYPMAALITPGRINDAKYSCTDSTVKNFFTVDNNFHTMLQVISAEEDVPHREALQTVEELVQNNSPVIITGNGGQGKTSLMMRAAVQWASQGNLTLWMPLSNKTVITEQNAEQFFDCLLASVPDSQRILLCIDNPFEGRLSFSSLGARWPRSAGIRLLMAERENRLTLLADPDQDRLLHWFDDANVIVMQGYRSKREYSLKNYPCHYFPENPERRNRILEKSTSYLVKDGTINKTAQLSIINQIQEQYGKPKVSLVELIYRTLFELKRNISKPENIKLDWEEWGELIRREFGEIDSCLQLYGVIAAFKIFHTPLTLSLFCKYFDLDKRKLKNRLRERFVPRHVEPIIYQEENQTLQPKHDVIAELFFLFNKDKVSIDSFISELIQCMDENETELFLTNIIDKREIQKGYKFPVGQVNYWKYMESIYFRIQKENLNLSNAGKAYLCLGFLWARNQKAVSKSNLTVKTVLETTAPEIEHNILMAKLYTEWGIWAAGEKNLSLAEEKFLAVLQCNPKQLPARTELARLLSKQKGREKEAERLLLQVMKIAPKDIQSRTELGRLLSKQKGREEEAEQFLLQVIKLDSRHIQSRTELARLLSRQKGREKEAEQFLLQALDIYPKHLHSRTVLAKLYESMNRLSDARRLYQELCELDPGNLFGKEGLARLGKQ